MSVLRDLYVYCFLSIAKFYKTFNTNRYFEPLRRIDADDRGFQHTNMSTDRLRVVSSMLEGGWQHTDAEALFRGLESVQDMSNEIMTILRPLLDESMPVSSRSKVLRSVMREFYKRVSSPDEDSMSPLSCLSGFLCQHAVRDT